MRATRCQFVLAAFAPLVFGTVANAEAPPDTVKCAEPAASVALGSAQWNGWGRDLDNTRYQPEPAIRAADAPKLALKWAYGFEGSVVAGQPTVADGRLFVAGATGRIYSLDAKTGCTFWTYEAQSGVRTTISIGELGVLRTIVQPKKARHKLAHVEVVKAPSAALFGDDNGAVYAVDAQRGTLLWKTQVATAAGTRSMASVVVYHQRVYVAVLDAEHGSGTEVSVAALELSSGHLVWSKALGAGVAAAPTIDEKHNWLYVATTSGKGGKASEIAALDLSDGKLAWAKKIEGSVDAPADIVAPLVLRSLSNGKQLLIAAQTSGVVYGLDPERGGERVWEATDMAGPGGGGVEYGLAADYRSVFVALSGLTSDPQTPVGSLTALDVKTGVRRWHTAAPAQACSWGGQSCWHAQAQAVTVLPGIVLSGAMDGHLRAYSTINGKIVWDFDTAKDYVTVNGVKASGGSLDQGGPTIVNGIVYVNSGYALRPGQPGNVLLAFSVDGK